MYNLVRKIHLHAGFIILMFLLMYFVSGYIMAHRPWFLPPAAPRTSKTVSLDTDNSLPLPQLAESVKNDLFIPGRIQFPQTQPPDEALFWINHPGTMVRVDVFSQDHTVRLTTQPAGWIGTLIMLHKIAGYDNEPLFDLYAFFCDLAGVSMILFALTGVYLWWKRIKNHAMGILCLMASCGYAIGMMLYFANAR